MRHARYNLIDFKVLVAGIVSLALFSCSPKIEDVAYVHYSNRFLDYLWITVNTRSGLFYGRESFLHFKRDDYVFSFSTKSNTYTEVDMDLRISRKKEIRIKPKRGKVTILDNPPEGKVIIVEIDDDNIPKIINGKYQLKKAGADAEHVWYYLRKGTQ